MKKQIYENRIDGYKVALAVRQLDNSEVWHECYDLEDEGVENILVRYGVFYQFTKAELAILKKHLLEMAAREEIREAVRWADQEGDPLLLSIPDRPIPSPRTLELQHKIFKAEVVREQLDQSRKDKEPKSIVDKIFKENKLEVI